MLAIIAFLNGMNQILMVSQELGKSLKQSTKDMVAVTSSGNNSQ
ncbi:hypothetical protein CK203_103903 [Vitis vinifera]|uniref:Uncharacterized protein n=1 Tax=Vitis vinifera TaxID=29760 RepID=A0A438CTQ9_VITVI|nr:hypothetical protein CK203_103903 [Vitis vinifera]